MKESHKPKAKNATFEVPSLFPLPHHTLPQVWVAWDPANYLPPYLVMKSLTRVEITKSGEVTRTALECAQSRRSPCPYEFGITPPVLGGSGPSRLCIFSHVFSLSGLCPSSSFASLHSLFSLRFISFPLQPTRSKEKSFGNARLRKLRRQESARMVCPEDHHFSRMSCCLTNYPLDLTLSDHTDRPPEALLK